MVHTMMTRNVAVTFLVEVTVDETKFTPEFLAEYATVLQDFDLEGHIKHIAFLEVMDLLRDDFTEGYGKLSEMGITATIHDSETEIEL